MKYSKWTAEEDEILMKLKEYGANDKTVSMIIDRSYQSINNRWNILRKNKKEFEDKRKAYEREQRVNNRAVQEMTCALLSEYDAQTIAVECDFSVADVEQIVELAKKNGVYQATMARVNLYSNDFEISQERTNTAVCDIKIKEGQ